MTKDQEETNQLDQKQLYNDALYWHLIHSGYTAEQAKFIIEKRLRDSIFW